MISGLNSHATIGRNARYMGPTQTIQKREARCPLHNNKIKAKIWEYEGLDWIPELTITTLLHGNPTEAGVLVETKPSVEEMEPVSLRTTSRDYDHPQEGRSRNMRQLSRDLFKSAYKVFC